MHPTSKNATGLSVLLLLCCTAWMPDVQAFRGRGAAFAVGAAAGSANAAPASSPQPAPQQQAPVPQQQPVAPQQHPAASGGLPLGTVVSSLPAGCTQTAQGGITYYNCGGDFYQAVFEGSTLKYVTTNPK